MSKLITGKDLHKLTRGEQAGSGEIPISEDPPKIEFPCDYPIKVLGDAVPDFTEVVTEVVLKYDSTLDASKVTFRDSGKGRFRAVTLVMRATGEAQLAALFEDLKATGIVKMVI